MTLFRLLTEGTKSLELSGNPDARGDAQQLLLAAFHLDMVHYLLNRMQELEGNDQCRSSAELYRSMIKRRSKRCPLQQILGNQEFMGLTFYVNRHVLIPRQDTETLVELVLEDQRQRCQGIQEMSTASEKYPSDLSGKPGHGETLLDLCTGSGCIAVSLAVKGSFAWVTATDLSEEALNVARRNGEHLLSGRQEDAAGGFGSACAIEFFQGDLFQALPQDGRKYDVITSNPPYIPTAVIRTLEPEVREHEPVMALDGSEDGLAYYHAIAGEAGKWLNCGGRIYLEIGHDQGAAVRELLVQAGFSEVRICKDLPGKDRVACGCWKHGTQNTKLRAWNPKQP